VDLDPFLQRMKARPGDRTLVALDVDGTISSIAPSPAEAVVDDELRATLRRLSGRLHLWLISGRDADEVRRMVGIGSVPCVGAHGLEVLDDRGLRPLFSANAVPTDFEKVVEEVAADVPEAVPYVERKRWSVAFHYRGVPRPSQVRERLRRSIEAHLPAGLRFREGKMVVEVVPAIEHDKGTALEWLIDSLTPERVLVAGDDLTDIAMFEALSERRARTGMDGLSVAVVQGSETPEPVVAAADTTVDGVRGLHRLLLMLLDRL
jgi:trehalose 6-phosphate phosphatase